MKLNSLIFLILLLMLTSCSNKMDSKENHLQLGNPKLLIKATELEKAGFDHHISTLFHMLVEKDFIYLLNREDRTLARFTHQGKADRKYQAVGQGPGEMVTPTLVFSPTQDTLAVLDIGKVKLLIFDAELNFQGEKAVDVRITKLIRDSGITYAFGDYGDFYLAILNDGYEVVKPFKEKPKELPFKGVLPYALFKGYPLYEKEIAATSWAYFRPECKAEILDIDTLKTKITLKWQHPAPPDQSDVLSRRKVYSCYYINKHNDLYVVQTHFNERLNSESRRILLVFRSDGKLISTLEVSFDLIPVYEKNSSKLYFVDDLGNINYWSLKDFNDRQ